ncbi:hypothetical protein BJ741DRAFT_709694 [Chytriomyces cf. hyalinus JEL632]|nr:hypothetical protein BJ741DRAFT_709694 [Chytriomyces cf. hyalinus JEL632]
MSAQVLQPASVVVLDSVAASIGIVGLVLIACVLAAVARYRSQLTPEMRLSSRTFDWTLITMLASSLVHALVITVENILTAIVNESPSIQDLYYGMSISGAVSVVVIYMTLFVLTGSNVLLAMERLWLVKNMTSVPVHWIYLLTAVTSISSTLVVASVAENASYQWDFAFMPFGMPPRMTKKQLISDLVPKEFMVSKSLFLIAIAYIPAMAIVSVIFYARAYFAIASKFQQPITAEHSLEYVSTSRIDRNNSNASGSPIYSQNPQSPTATTSSVSWTPPAMAILVRCVAMGAGILVFYLPTIAGIFITLTALRPEQQMPDWYLSACTILPALDTIWTPVVVLWCQANVRRVFFKMFRLKR